MCLFLGAAGAAAGGIGTAMSAISTIAGVGISIMQASAQQAAAMQQYQQQVQFRKEQEVQAQKTLNLQVAQQQAALESEKNKAQGEKADLAIEANAVRSATQTAKTESGIVGVSLGNILNTVDAKLARAEGKIDYNSNVAYYNANNELKMAQRGHGARLAEIPIPVKPRFNMGLEIASAVVGGIGNLGSLAMKSESMTPGYQQSNSSYF